MDWRQVEDYAWCSALTAPEWAWQFLRRNPEYHADYAWFIAVWRDLEELYGAPPERDFYRWRQDPRAWRSEAQLGACPTEGCAAEDEKILIECWMGAKWGLRKFPIDPAVARPEPGLVLDWRDQSVATPVLSPGAEEYLLQRQGKLGLGFDLSLPLSRQLEEARRTLIAARRSLERAGELPPRGLAAARSRWTVLLRLLDGQESGAGLEELAETLNLADVEKSLAEARDLVSAGYRKILWLDQ